MPAKRFIDAGQDNPAATEGPEAATGALAAARAAVSRSFDRGLSPEFIARLQAESRTGGWWSDVLADHRLLIAVRGEYLNVYWRGMSLFHVSPGGAGLTVTTHVKYLVDPKLAAQVRLVDGEFVIDEIKKTGFIHQYKGAATIAAMKTAAGLFTDLEKTGCHEIAVRNANVIDCEIAFPRAAASAGRPDGNYGRADLASVEAGDAAGARLVFWEAKHFRNRDLRSNEGLPPVCEQITKYRAYLAEHRQRILESYSTVAANLVAIREMGGKRPLSHLISEVGTGKRPLVMDEQPKVGLLIFGFDNAQKWDKAWQARLVALQDAGYIVHAVGDAKGIRLKT